MKTITLEENSIFREVRDSGGRWYWSMSEPYGDLSEAAQMRAQQSPYKGDRLVLVRASDGETFTPVEQKNDEALGEPFWFEWRIYIPCLNLHDNKIVIKEWKPGHMSASSKVLISHEEKEDYQNLRFYGKPLTLAAEKDDHLQIVWPENIIVKKDASETFCFREGEDLFFSVNNPDHPCESETVRRNIYTGGTEEVYRGSVRRQENGDLWLLSSVEKAVRKEGPSRKVLIYAAVCMLILLAFGAACIALHHDSTVLPVWWGMALFAAAAGGLSGKLIPLKTQLRLAMPLFIILVLILSVLGFNHIGTWEPLDLLGIDAFPTGLIPILYIGGAYYISKYSSFSMSHLFIPSILLMFIPGVLAVLGGSSWLLTAMFTFLRYAVKLGRSNRFSPDVKEIMSASFAALVFGLILIPLVIPRLSSNAYIIARFSDNPWAQDYIAALRNARLFGESSLYLYDIPASEYFSKGSLVTLVMAFLMKYGWLPLAGVLAANGVLLLMMTSVARHSANSFGRNLVTVVYSLFTVRILMNAISIYLRSPLYCAMPFSGDLLSMSADVFVCTFALMLCTKSDDAVTDLLDQERGTVSMMDALIEVIMEVDEDEEWDEDAEFEAAGRKWKLKELLADRNALAEERITQEAILQKYGDAMVEKIAPGSWQRSMVFISYNHNDSRVAKYMANALEEAGGTAWYYERDIKYGSYPEQIMKALRQSKIFVVILSSNSNNSEEVKNEVFNAQRMVKDGIVLLPLVIEDIELSDFMQHYLGRYEQSFAQKRPIKPEVDQFVLKILDVCKELADNENKNEGS